MNGYTARMSDNPVSPPENADAGREKSLARIAHDLRTPLAVLNTTVSMLLNPKYDFTPDQVREQLVRVQRNVDLLKGMVGDLANLVNGHDPAAIDA
jgi:K+-sensing histidine kinase KdpD